MAGRRLRLALRLLGSSVLASIIVFAMLLTGLRIWGVFDEPERGLDLQSLRLLSSADRTTLAALLGDDRLQAPPAPALEDIPRLPAGQPGISGFVQLEVDIAPDGSVREVEVTGAMPVGVYEEQARKIALERHYPPSATGDARTRTEIIDFKVPRD